MRRPRSSARSSRATASTTASCLIARYLEERRKHDIDDALAAAIVGTLRPTAVASLGAAIAYGSLAATSFKGFADFA